MGNDSPPHLNTNFQFDLQIKLPKHKLRCETGLLNPLQDTRFKKALDLDLDDPQDVVVDPLSGKMFVSDYGSNPKIYSAKMDGGDRKVFVESKVLWPTSLAIGTS